MSKKDGQFEYETDTDPTSAWSDPLPDGTRVEVKSVRDRLKGGTEYWSPGTVDGKPNSAGVYLVRMDAGGEAIRTRNDLVVVEVPEPQPARKPKTYKDVQAGDPVLVFDRNGKRTEQPGDGWPGEVVKAGPKLVYVKYGGPSLSNRERSEGRAFRRETGRANDGYGYQRIATPEQHAEAKRKTAAADALYERGISSRSTSGRFDYPAELLELLAATIDTYLAARPEEEGE